MHPFENIRIIIMVNVYWKMRNLGSCLGIIHVLSLREGNGPLHVKPAVTHHLNLFRFCPTNLRCRRRLRETIRNMNLIRSHWFFFNRVFVPNIDWRIANYSLVYISYHFFLCSISKIMLTLLQLLKNNDPFSRVAEWRYSGWPFTDTRKNCSGNV